ncbi:hypothetical protein J2X31_001216 [Flavobacterium arsenatis]|uniref:DUF4919 domain-containing protein n=1 Tax=Flavobacterium arsenatis TaxID=1484332 RepID=A0ABU1TMM3_9FLAO|nr:hypothetical protein [Flavobacterium arsenatis]MDR6967209.1 hypothetical protein [Flavobacterium arsenatis]
MKINQLHIVLLTLLCIHLNTSAQTTEQNTKGWTFRDPNAKDTAQVRVNTTFLLLGTLNDYNGYNRSIQKNQFDTYYPYEKPLMKYIDSIAKKDFNINLEEQKNGFISDKLASKMKSFYADDLLIDSLLDTDDKKLSYLLGVYLRNGEKISDDVYKIQLANSRKHNNVYIFLKELKCNSVFFKRMDGFPTIYYLYFQPTELMKKYFATVETEKSKLALSEKASKRATSEESQKKRNDAKELWDLQIIEMFK